MAWPGSRLLAHRPEQRALVRLTGDGDTYDATVLRPGLDGDLGRRLGGIAGLLHGAARLPAVQDWPIDDGVLVLSALAGLRPDEATLARVPVYEMAARLRLAGEYAFQPRWRGLSRALLAAATP